ncbi:MAG TPA: 5'/3'-nucleotidase SurE [Polyangiaceae bacterium LLY-WYZ-14_1]|nr:5'/3'-nucleotidase SurE [Polyangiaceae bacterium LLY-WYZ-14_1]
MSDPRPLLLLANDDGVDAPGLRALKTALEAVAEVVVVAPEREQSGHSHSITLQRPLRLNQVDPGVWAIDGTPADCTYVGLFHPKLLPRTPDLVVSGINHGPNLGADVFYSGTVAAAREGAFRGVPAIAFSQCGRGDFAASAHLAREMVTRLLEAQRPPGDAPLLNVNFPEKAPTGVRATILGRRRYTDEVDVRRDPRGREYLWIGGPLTVHHEPVEGADTEAIDDGFVSVTPLLIRATQPDHLGVAAWVAGVKVGEGERAPDPAKAEDRP